MIDEKRTVAEKEAPKEGDGLLTKEAFVAQMHQLTELARAAGLNPLQLMAKAYVQLAESVVKSILAGLENQDIPEKKK